MIVFKSWTVLSAESGKAEVRDGVMSYLGPGREKDANTETENTNNFFLNLKSRI